MFKFLLLIFLLGNTESFVHKFRFSTSATKILKIHDNDNLNDLSSSMSLYSVPKSLKIMTTTIIASSLLFSASNIAYADLGDDDNTSTTPISVTNGPKPITVKTKSTKDTSSSVSSSTTGGGERDYQASLLKEKNKANAMKSKTKEEKRRDLCEALGRGC